MDATLVATLGIGASVIGSVIVSHVRLSARLSRIEAVLGLDGAPGWQEREQALFAARVRRYCTEQCPSYEPTGVKHQP